MWDESPYDGTRLLIHLAMADHANEQGWFFAAQPTLAAKARCSVQHLRKTVEQMIDDGVIEIVKKGSSRGKATEYRLLKPPKQVALSLSENPQTLDVQPPNSDTTTPKLHHVPTVLSNLPDTTLADGEAAAREWWDALPVKPIGRNAWWSLKQICKAASERGYTDEQIVAALTQIGVVPSMAQMDRQLRNVVPAWTRSARQQRLARGYAAALDVWNGEPQAEVTA